MSKIAGIKRQGAKIWWIIPIIFHENLSVLQTQIYPILTCIIRNLWNNLDHSRIQTTRGNVSLFLIASEKIFKVLQNSSFHLFLRTIMKWADVCNFFFCRC